MDECRFHGLRLFLVVVDRYSKVVPNNLHQPELTSMTFNELAEEYGQRLILETGQLALPVSKVEIIN
jgi:hypothetical protein